MSESRKHKETSLENDGCLVIESLSGTVIATCVTPKTAVRIARACNSHCQLVEALQGLFGHCAMIHKRWGEGCNAIEAKAAILAARAAIASVTP